MSKDETPTIVFETKRCLVCGKTSQMTVSKRGFEAWQTGLKVQDAFPDMPKEYREMLISGTHPECWHKLF